MNGTPDAQNGGRVLERAVVYRVVFGAEIDTDICQSERVGCGDGSLGVDEAELRFGVSAREGIDCFLQPTWDMHRAANLCTRPISCQEKGSLQGQFFNIFIRLDHGYQHENFCRSPRWILQP